MAESKNLIISHNNIKSFESHLFASALNKSKHAILKKTKQLFTEGLAPLSGQGGYGRYEVLA